MTSIRSRLDAGLPVFGAFNNSADPVQIERLSSAGWDLVIVDLQHGSTTMQALVPAIMAIELGGATAFVRVPWNEPAAIMRALDSGAAGVVVPAINNAAEAAAAARACRYPPLGDRSFGQLRGKSFGGTDGANAEILCIVMIETADGLANLEEIVQTPGVDGVFVGPVDLKLGIGLKVTTPGTEPSFVTAMNDILDGCVSNGRIAGSFFMSGDDIAAALGSGWKFIITLPTAQVGPLRELAAR